MVRRGARVDRGRAGHVCDPVGHPGRLAEHGFTDAVTTWPRSTGWFAGQEAVLDTVAADVLPFC
jgi:hypothetical protein